MKARVPIAGTVGKSIQFDPRAGARAEAAVAALAKQISVGLGGSIRHSSLQGLQIGDDHPQYTGNAFPETITGQWNFATIPRIQGETLAEYIEDVVGGSFFDFLQDTTSVVWTYFDTAQHLEANVPPEFVQDTVGAMLVDTSTVDFTYDDPTGKISAIVPGAALTKTDDTNVTLALGGSPTTALARAASLTLGWTGQLAVSRGGTGNSALAALTKTDDANVTLTLGGTPATALVNAASLTLGWTGQLSVPRGGSGAATLTGYLKGNGAAAFTAVSTIPYSDINGTPTIPAGANPSANIGLSAVNGVATSFMRSDGAPALSQSIAPTWTGQHVFTNSTGIPLTISTTAPLFALFETDQAVDNRRWGFQANGGKSFYYAGNDADSTSANVWQATRSGVAITLLELGNATDNTAFTFLGTGNLKFGGSTTGAQTATFAATNKPGSGTAGPIAWIPVLTAGGTQGYVPVFGA